MKKVIKVTYKEKSNCMAEYNRIFVKTAVNGESFSKVKLLNKNRSVVTETRCDFLIKHCHGVFF